jgi:hypothetical protein
LEDPAGFVSFDGLTVIDEIQRAPEVLLAIKATVDANPRPGRFLLTESSRLLGLRDLPDTLPGRMETIELWPFSQGEIDSAPTASCAAGYLRPSPAPTHAAADDSSTHTCRTSLTEKSGSWPRSNTFHS